MKIKNIVIALVLMSMLIGIAGATTVNKVNTATFQTTISTAKDKLMPGQSLTANQFLKAPNNHYVLYMQTDGNLVLYRTNANPNPKTWIATWSTFPIFKPGDVTWVTMQKDGDFRIFSYNIYGLVYAEITSSKFYNYIPNSYIQLQNDGNLVLYSPARVALWATNTR